ncbi:hypothetical protein TNCV_3521301 [Trichonephila clavipes]|nr:hypothetical protein TNCV_3521301 [Trichonephila clavipes]
MVPMLSTITLRLMFYGPHAVYYHLATHVLWSPCCLLSPCDSCSMAPMLSTITPLNLSVEFGNILDAFPDVV